MSATSSTSACSTPRICWRRSRSPPASGLVTSRCRSWRPFNLGLNGNAITVSPALHAAIMGEIDGDPFDPMATALALSRVVATRRKSGAEPLTFGMTFPFSTHNYQLRFWMAAGGVDPDEDVRLVVLPPPYMVDSLAKRPGRRVLRRRALEFDRGRSWRRAHPAFRLGYPGPRGREGARCQAKLVGEESGSPCRADPGRISRR